MENGGRHFIETGGEVRKRGGERVRVMVTNVRGATEGIVTSMDQTFDFIPQLFMTPTNLTDDITGDVGDTHTPTP